MKGVSIYLHSWLIYDTDLPMPQRQHLSANIYLRTTDRIGQRSSIMVKFYRSVKQIYWTTEKKSNFCFLLLRVKGFGFAKKYPYFFHRSSRFEVPWVRKSQKQERPIHRHLFKGIKAIFRTTRNLEKHMVRQWFKLCWSF